MESEADCLKLSVFHHKDTKNAKMLFVIFVSLW